MAQGKRGGLITRRAVDRNHSLLTINSFCAIREKNRIQNKEETHTYTKATNRSDISKQTNKQTSKHSHSFYYCHHKKRTWIDRFFFNLITLLSRSLCVCVCVCVCVIKKRRKRRKRLQHSEFPGCLQP